MSFLGRHFNLIGGRKMSVTTDVGGAVGTEGKTGLGFYFKTSGWWLFGMVFIGAVCGFCIWYQQTFAHLYGLDSHTPEFDKYFMTFLYTEFVIEAILAVTIWSYLWMTRDRHIAAVGPKEEIRRYYTFVMWLLFTPGPFILLRATSLSRMVPGIRLYHVTQASPRATS